MWIVRYKRSILTKSQEIWYDHKEDAVDHARKLIREGYWVQITLTDKGF